MGALEWVILSFLIVFLIAVFIAYGYFRYRDGYKAGFIKALDECKKIVIESFEENKKQLILKDYFNNELDKKAEPHTDERRND